MAEKQEYNKPLPEFRPETKPLGDAAGERGPAVNAMPCSANAVAPIIERKAAFSLLVRAAAVLLLTLLTAKTATLAQTSDPTPGHGAVGAESVILTHDRKLTAGDGLSGDKFGESVSVSGDRIVVGVPNHDADESTHQTGAVYVFEKNSDGEWSQTAKLAASDAAAESYFGRGVSVSGDRIVAGAYGENGYTGAAYVFEKNSDGEWSQTAKLAASDAAAESYFGRGVSVSGDRIVAGAYGENGHRGAVYVFEKNSDGEWSQSQKLTASDSKEGDCFGYSVSVSGDRVVAGARCRDAFRGTAYVFERNSDGTWSQTNLTAGDGVAGDGFGTRVSVSGERVIVGAYGNSDGAIDSGAAYVFERNSDGTWSQTKLTASDAAAYDHFGMSVSLSGTRAVVGAIWDDDGGSKSGAAYVFEKNSDGEWSEVRKLVAGDAAEEDAFGYSVSVSGDRTVVGAPDRDSGENYMTGAAYVYDPSARNTPGDGGTEQPDPGEEGPVARVSETVSLPGSGKLTASDRAEGDLFGISVSVSGKMAAVGASVNSTVSRKLGSVYVFEKGPSGTWSQTKLTASDTAFDDAFGRSVSVSGERVIAGAQGDDDGGSASGAAYVFERSSDGTWSRTKLTASDAAANDGFGASVSVSGERAIVGAPKDDDGGSASGAAYVFERSSDGTWSETKLTASDAAADDRFGTSVSVSGTRAVVGAPWDDDGGSASGAAYVFERSSDGTWSQTKLTASDAAADDRFGTSVSVSGTRAVVGAPLDDGGGSNSGAAYVFERSSDGTWSEVSKLLADDGAAGDTFGRSVAVSGERIIVGAETDGDNGEASGSAYVFKRNSDGTWSQTAKLLAEDGAAVDTFGQSVAVSGNVAFIGAVGDDTGRGSVYVYEPSATAPPSGPGTNTGAGTDDRTNQGTQEGRGPEIYTTHTSPRNEQSSSGSGGCAIFGGDNGASAMALLILIPALVAFGKKKQ